MGRAAARANASVHCCVGEYSMAYQASLPESCGHSPSTGTSGCPSLRHGESLFCFTDIQGSLSRTLQCRPSRTRSSSLRCAPGHSRLTLPETSLVSMLKSARASVAVSSASRSPSSYISQDPRPQPPQTSSTTSYSLPAPGESRRTYLGVSSLVSRRGLCCADHLRARVFSRR